MHTLFIEALRFAAEKHISQRKKGCNMIPYINHLIHVTHILHSLDNELDDEILCAALLHDVIEDTDTTTTELTAIFGQKTAGIVAELTDDMTLTYEERKKQQIHKAIVLTPEAKKIKIADKIANIEDLITRDFTWSNHRKRQYITWSQQVVNNRRGTNPALEKTFDETAERALNQISEMLNS